MRWSILVPIALLTLIGSAVGFTHARPLLSSGASAGVVAVLARTLLAVGDDVSIVETSR
jgi:hypothetical protein